MRIGDIVPQGTNFQEAFSGATLIPEGTYVCYVKEANDTQIKDRPGQEYLACRFVIMGPSQKGRIVFENINHTHPNTQVVEIAYRAIGAIFAALGTETIDENCNTNDWIGGILKTKIGIQEAKGQWEAKNIVKAYYKATPEEIAACELPPAPQSTASQQKKTFAPPPPPAQPSSRPAYLPPVETPRSSTEEVPLTEYDNIPF